MTTKPRYQVDIEQLKEAAVQYAEKHLLAIDGFASLPATLQDRIGVAAAEGFMSAFCAAVEWFNSDGSARAFAPSVMIRRSVAAAPTTSRHRRRR